MQLVLGERDEGSGGEAQIAHANPYGGDQYGGDGYGGLFGGDPYGGATYAGWTIPQWSYSAPNRMPKYNITNGLTGAIEGVVTWGGAVPGKLMTTCGPIDNPTLRVGSDKGVRGALVYIEKVSIGRVPVNYGKPAVIGGLLVKHGCALTPAAQLVAPLPAALSIHGDAQRARVRIAGKSYDLDEAGLVRVEVKAGVTKIESEDGKLGAAWVIAIDTPYFAITDDTGRFRIDELAAGTYDVTFWQAPVATVGNDGVFSYGAPIVVHRSVTVDGARPAHVDVRLK